MKAMRVHAYGLDVAMRLDEVDEPKPARDELLGRLRAAGVNPSDVATDKKKVERESLHAVRTTFVKAHLARAIRLTCEQQSTESPLTIKVFAQPFIDAEQTQWRAFRNRFQQDHFPA